MQSVVLNKGLLTELSRCDRSFVMSLFWHNLDNDSLEQKGGVSADNSSVYDMRREMLLGIDPIRDAIRESGGTSNVTCSTSDVYEKIRKTEELINAGGPRVIIDGALGTDGFIAKFSVMTLFADGTFDVYCLSTKSGAFDNEANKKKSIENAHKEAALLSCVLKDKYRDSARRIIIVGADKRYLTPYPDPATNKIVVDPNEAMYRVEIELPIKASVKDILGFDPESEKARILATLSNDPFAIPEAELGSKCKDQYTCPFYSYCKSRKDPNSVFFYMPSSDAKKLEENGIETMEDLLDLSYEYPGLCDIPRANGNGTYDVSEIALRELRSYEKQTI